MSSSGMSPASVASTSSTGTRVPWITGLPERVSGSKGVNEAYALDHRTRAEVLAQDDTAVSEARRRLDLGVSDA